MSAKDDKAAQAKKEDSKAKSNERRDDNKKEEDDDDEEEHLNYKARSWLPPQSVSFGTFILFAVHNERHMPDHTRMCSCRL